MKVRRWRGETWYDSDRRSPCFSLSSPSSWSIVNLRTFRPAPSRPWRSACASSDFSPLAISCGRSPTSPIFILPNSQHNTDSHLKSRVWALRQFSHFPALHGHTTNIAAQVPYPDRKDRAAVPDPGGMSPNHRNELLKTGALSLTFQKPALVRRE